MLALLLGTEEFIVYNDASKRGLISRPALDSG